jgi:ribosomal protein S5
MFTSFTYEQKAKYIYHCLGQVSDYKSGSDGIFCKPKHFKNRGGRCEATLHSLLLSIGAHDIVSQTQCSLSTANQHMAAYNSLGEQTASQIV